MSWSEIILVAVIFLGVLHFFIWLMHLVYWQIPWATANVSILSWTSILIMLWFHFWVIQVIALGLAFFYGLIVIYFVWKLEWYAPVELYLLEAVDVEGLIRCKREMVETWDDIHLLVSSSLSNSSITCISFQLAMARCKKVFSKLLQMSAAITFCCLGYFCLRRGLLLAIYGCSIAFSALCFITFCWMMLWTVELLLIFWIGNLWTAAISSLFEDQ